MRSSQHLSSTRQCNIESSVWTISSIESGKYLGSLMDGGAAILNTRTRYLCWPHIYTRNTTATYIYLVLFKYLVSRCKQIQNSNLKMQVHQVYNLQKDQPSGQSYRSISFEPPTPNYILIDITLHLCWLDIYIYISEIDHGCLKVFFSEREMDSVSSINKFRHEQQLCKDITYSNLVEKFDKDDNFALQIF